ncbi:hypothetical protein [Sphingomonas cavernae]|uniref:DUF4136 domain-containing protein n=1 Tax=Sphingomonas cavernae TaxID=2320861 RepID=A0A418WQJ2_9SPHN|nr:hypothetical protein [Sphingomonas cavernae]RJF93466.1 hypothetical protein D3876_03830 [Sphingomonas cavernae]
MTRTLKIWGGATLAALTLAGCARAPEYSFVSRGDAPDARTRYALVQPEGEAPVLSPEIEAALVPALAAQGLVQAEPNTKPDLLLFAGVARRPAKVASFTRDNPGDTAEAPGWIATPDRHGRRVTTLALRFVDPATGTVVRSVRAEARHGKRQAEMVIAPLVEGATAGRMATQPES